MISDCFGVNNAGHLTISGCDTVGLAEQYGTPVYVMSDDDHTGYLPAGMRHPLIDIMAAAGSRCMPAKHSAVRRSTVSS